MDITFLKSSAEFQTWLGENHDKATELWVGFYKRAANKVGITYPDALDQALCFGWIDGVRKNVNEMSYTIRFSPRKSNSSWSSVNIKRAEELSRLGLMRSAGLEAFERGRETRQYSYENRARKLDEPHERRFKENGKAWDFFQAQPPGYQRVVTWWVMSAKREETRLRRLTSLIEYSERGERLPMLTPPRRSKA